MYVCMYVCVYVCMMYVCMYVCVCVCMYVCMYVCAKHNHPCRLMYTLLLVLPSLSLSIPPFPCMCVRVRVYGALCQRTLTCTRTRTLKRTPHTTLHTPHSAQQHIHTEYITISFILFLHSRGCNQKKELKYYHQYSHNLIHPSLLIYELSLEWISRFQ